MAQLEYSLLTPLFSTLHVAGQQDVQPAEPQQQQLAERDLVKLTMEQFAMVARSRSHDFVLDLSLQV